jgi:hypothetical protein
MRIGEITYWGFNIWPPQWAIPSQIINEKAVFKDVKPIVGTALLRIDIEHEGISHLGVIFADREIRESLYHKLKENVGRQLAEIADLEIGIDQEMTAFLAQVG